MTQTAHRIPPPAPENSAFCGSEDIDNLLCDAKQSLNCIIWLISGTSAEMADKHLDAVRREDLASLLRLVGHKIEHAQQVYRAA